MVFEGFLTYPKTMSNAICLMSYHLTAFRVDAGTLTLVGVSPLSQHRTCVSGRTCALGEVLGQDLATTDAYIVLGRFFLRSLKNFFGTLEDHCLES